MRESYIIINNGYPWPATHGGRRVRSFSRWYEAYAEAQKEKRRYLLIADYGNDAARRQEFLDKAKNVRVVRVQPPQEQS